MIITKTQLPAHSILKTNGVKYDYVDSYQGQFLDESRKIEILEIGKSFFSSSPKWIDTLFEFRNKVVGILGLKTSGNEVDRQEMLANFRCEKGEQLGLFRVYEKTTNEIILGEDDKHLNFRVSLFLEEGTSDMKHRILTISTAVTFNHWFGRIYFLPVRPFHSLIVPTMLKGIIHNIEK